MKATFHNSLFILLVAVSIISLHASTEQTKPGFRNNETVLDKCVKQLKSHLDLSTLPAGNVYAIEDCRLAIELILKNAHFPISHRTQSLLVHISDGLLKHLKQSRTSPHSETSKGNIIPNILKKRDGDFYSKYIYPKISKNLAGNPYSLINAQSNNLANPGADFSSSHDKVLPVDFNEMLASGALRPNQRFFRPNSLSTLPRVYSNIGDSNGKTNGAWEHDATHSNDISLTEKAPPFKRAAGSWFNVVNADVAKRRRQTLSINNALMALTDMVMEHGREKLMRNRDNLRYHMLVQG